ncbi:MFS transporter [candidate division KSB1 bacterium]|nr:MFS transporter [candidate division KSB1 bacterium]
MGIFKAPRALQGINVSYFLEGLAYFGVLTILGKFMSENVGLSDLHAGWIYSLFTGGITLAMLFLGGVVDKIGVRKALRISLLLMVVGRFFLAASSSLFPQGGGFGSTMFFTLIVGIFIVVIGYGMYQPAAYAGIKLFTNKKTAAMGYAMIYALMNLGAFFSGLMSPPLRNNFGIETVFWAYVVITILAVISLILLLTKRVEKRTIEQFKKESQEGVEKSAPEPQEQTPQTDIPRKSIFDTRLLIFAVITICAIGMVFYNNLSENPPEYEVTLKKHLDFLKTLVNVSDSDPEAFNARLGASLEDHRAQIAATIDALQSPALESGEVDSIIFMAVKEKLRNDHAYVSGLIRCLPFADSLSADSQVHRQIYDEIRQYSVFAMALAYSFVANVNREVITSLRKRLKEVDEDIIPMPEKLTGEIERVCLLPLSDKLREYAVFAGQTAAQPALDGIPVIRRKILSDSAYAAGAIQFASDSNRNNQNLNQFLSDKFISDAMLALDQARTIRLAKPVLTVDLLNLKLASDETLIAGSIDRLDAGVAIPFGKRFTAWLSAYGIYLIIGVIFLFLAVSNILKKRPEHPFNNGRFVFFVFILIPVQTLFAHNWLTIPYYINRGFGGTAVGDNFEFFSNLNPILIFVLTPLVAAITQKVNVYKMMILGTLVMALPTFLLTVGPSAALLMVYILLMSIGEAMWQPRFLQYVAEIAPEGKTGAYMGIAQFPWFLTKVVTGLYSGWFLAHYCPIVGPQNTEFLWFIYACIAMVSPIALFLARNWVGDKMHK